MSTGMCRIFSSSRPLARAFRVARVSTRARVAPYIVPIQRRPEPAPANVEASGYGAVNIAGGVRNRPNDGIQTSVFSQDGQRNYSLRSRTRQDLPQ